MDTGVSLDEYQRAEIEVLAEEARREFRTHVAVYVTVNCGLVLFNLVFADDTIWFPYPIVGWGLGLTFHYLAGVRSVRQGVAQRQSRIEERAVRMRSS